MCSSNPRWRSISTPGPRGISYLKRPTLISREALRRTFGAGYADTPQVRVMFRAMVLDALGRVYRVDSAPRLGIEDAGILLLPSAPRIPRITRRTRGAFPPRRAEVPARRRPVLFSSCAPLPGAQSDSRLRSILLSEGGAIQKARFRESEYDRLK